MFQWIQQNHIQFAQISTEIGDSMQKCSELQEKHRQFATKSMVCVETFVV